tara:strand:+ start:1763 stop:3214 length:1452 start_codon:yes stop_codon:yes gene_type:complete
MLGSIRKFSSSIYAKILLGIVVIPFVFWGMGSSFIGGNKNIIVVIENEKYPIEDFINFIQRNSASEQKFNDATVESFLSAFIGEKLIESEIENFDIKLSDESLARLIKHQKDFKRENDFSRIEYEKFLIKNNITAAFFEQNLSMQEKKKQLLEFIGGGILPSNFLANDSYNKINQKRYIELINLNEIFGKKVNFSEGDMKSYFNSNKDSFKEVHKSFKLLELTPKKLVNNEEFSDLFFKKIDEIDDSLISGKNLNFIIEKYNLEKAKPFIINSSGKNIYPEDINFLNKDLINAALALNEEERTVLIENENKYFIVEFEKTKDIQKNLEDSSVKKQIILNLEKNIKRKFLSEIISKINNKKFNESDFYSLSRNENVPVKKIFIESIIDDKILKKEIISQIYSYPQNKVIIVNDVGLTEVYLIYIDKVENVAIDENSEEYAKYLNLSKTRITSNLFNTYDTLIRRKYEIDVNEQALDAAKNYLIN